jgi:hypothetical protein
MGGVAAVAPGALRSWPMWDRVRHGGLRRFCYVFPIRRCGSQEIGFMGQDYSQKMCAANICGYEI